MPGSSLWLIPPSNSPFSRQIQTQITSLIPLRFYSIKPPTFIPHVTITSNIDASVHGADGQAWLDSLDLPLTQRDVEAIAARKAAAAEAPSETAAESIDEQGVPAKDNATTEPTDEPARPSQANAEDTAPATISSAGLKPEAVTGNSSASSSTSPTPAKPSESAASAEPLEIEVNLHSLEAGNAFFRKLTLLASKPCPALSDLTIACRAQGVYKGDWSTARSWEEAEYGPHLSLMYADLPKKEVQKMIPAVLQDLERARAIIKPKRDGIVARGGKLVLVPTDKPIDQWKPIAGREIPGLIWKWTST